jgi:hypothetical protein
MTNKEQIEALYVTAQKLSDDFEALRNEANEFINKLLIEAGIEEQVSKKQQEVEAKREEIQMMVDAILSKIQELQLEETPE